MERPKNLNREYLESCIGDGRDVYVPGHGVISTVKDLPSQAELDKQLPDRPKNVGTSIPDGTKSTAVKK